MTRRARAPRIFVERGQVYRVLRDGQPPRHVQVASVSEGATSKGQQPIARLFEVTRNGARKGRKRIVTARNLDGTPRETKANLISHWLTWDVERHTWNMGARFELVED